MDSTNRHPLHVGLLSAMPQELGTILKNLKSIEKIQRGDLLLYSGVWKNNNNVDLIITTAWSGWGKVSAARATTHLSNFKYKEKSVDFLFFTGVAGGVNKHQNQWDIIIADEVIQHDMDASPLYKEFVIPSINNSKIFPDSKLKEKLFQSLNKAKKEGKLKRFKSIYEGLIGTGDKFIDNEESLKIIKQKIPELMAVEMEGAAFAQVAFQENKPWILIRVISDNANSEAFEDFNSFLQKYEKESWQIIKTFFNYL